MEALTNYAPVEPVAPKPVSVTLECSLAEAQAIYDVMGSLNHDTIERLAVGCYGMGTSDRLHRLAAEYASPGKNPVTSTWECLNETDGVLRYDQAVIR